MIGGTTIGAAWTSGAERAAADLDAVGLERFVARDFEPGRIRHVVLFRFDPLTAVADVDEVSRRFLALRGECRRDGEPYIESIEAGAQISTEGAGDGFDRGFIVTFSSRGDRNYYVGAPIVVDEGSFDAAHHAFKEFAGRFLDTAGVVVFDLAV